MKTLINYLTEGTADLNNTAKVIVLTISGVILLAALAVATAVILNGAPSLNVFIQ